MSIKFKRGLKVDLPTGELGEPLYCTDTNELFIGQGIGNPAQLVQGKLPPIFGKNIISIEKTKTEGLVDTYTITYSDKSTYDFTITNGAKGEIGSMGPQGEQGIQGPEGPKGDDGLTVSVKVNGSVFNQYNGIITLPSYPSDANGGTMDLSLYQTKLDTSLTTSAKEIIPSINEINTQLLKTNEQFNTIKNEKSDKSTTTNLQQQVNNLVLGAVGDGNNAEIVQSRGEYKLLSDRLNNNDDVISNISIKIEGINLLNSYDSRIEIGKNINGTTGITNTDSKYILTYFIPIKPSLYFLLSGYSSTNSWGRTLKYGCNYALFNSDKVFISGVNNYTPSVGTTKSLITTTSDTAYIRIAIPYEANVTLERFIENKVMLFETTLETCATDEKKPFEDYINENRVSYDNLTDDLKDIIDLSKYTNEVIGIDKIRNNFRYLVPSFRGSVKNSLILLGTNDLKRFDLIAKQGVYTVKNPTSTCLRDPSIIQIDDYYYLMYTTCGFVKGNEIGFCRTKDFVNYEELSNIPVANPESTGDFYYVWAPAWFRDIDGSLYIISACSVDSTSFYTYISKYDETTHTIVSTHKTNIKSIDGHVYYENGTYYMFVGGAFMWKSDSILGIWTGLGNIGNLYYTGYEADFAVRLEDGSWRLYMQELPQAHSSAHMVYVDAPSIEGTWSEPKRVEYTKKALDYIRSINGNDLNTEYYHWTIYDFNRVLGNNNYFKS